MYRKTADRLIVRDVKLQLVKLQKQYEWADWRLAVTASCASHPEYYRQYQNQPLHETIEPLLHDGGVDMTCKDLPFTFIGNMAPEP